MTENQKRILEMLAENKISTEEAYRLLNAVDFDAGEPAGPPKTEAGVKTRPKYLRVTITPGEEGKGKADHVNVKVPMSLIRAGIKLTSLIPPHAYEKVNSALKDKGIDFDLRSIKSDDIEELIEALGDMEVDIDGGRGEKVKVFVE